MAHLVPTGCTRCRSGSSVAVASVMTPAIAASLRAQDSAAASAAQSRAFEIALGISLPAAIALAVLAHPIVGGLFERGAFWARDTAAVAAALTAIALGLPGHAIEKVLGAVSFAHEDTHTPLLTALAGLATAAAGAVTLFPAFGIAGIAAAVASAGWVSALILGLVLTAATGCNPTTTCDAGCPASRWRPSLWASLLLPCRPWSRCSRAPARRAHAHQRDGGLVTSGLGIYRGAAIARDR